MRKAAVFACVFAAGLAVSFAPLRAQGNAAKGKEVFDQQCAVCHKADSEEKKLGPGLKGLFKKAKMNNGKQPTVENVTKVVQEGGNGMPAYAEILSKEELAGVLAYLQTL